jgi:hypothetical protein
MFSFKDSLFSSSSSRRGGKKKKQNPIVNTAEHFLFDRQIEGSFECLGKLTIFKAILKHKTREMKV